MQGVLSSLAKKYSPRYIKAGLQNAESLDVPKNWHLAVSNFDILLLNKHNKTLNAEFTHTKKVEKNLAWTLRRKDFKYETSKLVKIIKDAVKTGNPLTDKMTEELQGQPFVFASQTLLAGPKIERMFLVTKEVKEFPDFQYLAIGLKARSNITEGSVLSGKFTYNTDLQRLACFSALASDEKIEDSCIGPEDNFMKIKEFELFTKETTAIIVKVSIKNKPVQFLCPDNADIIHSKGLLIVVISPLCSIRCAAE